MKKSCPLSGDLEDFLELRSVCRRKFFGVSAARR
jgi:hypothetical protein